MNFNAASSYIASYVNSTGIPWTRWYVGITNDPDNRLFSEHGVSPDGLWAQCSLDSDSSARELEKYFLELGMKGGGGGGNSSSKTVYAYHITSETKQST